MMEKLYKITQSKIVDNVYIKSINAKTFLELKKIYNDENLNDSDKMDLYNNTKMLNSLSDNSGKLIYSSIDEMLIDIPSDEYIKLIVEINSLDV